LILIGTIELLVLLYAKGGGAWVRDQYSVTTGGNTVATGQRAVGLDRGWRCGVGLCR
jgi:hypothetical protein